MHKLGLQEKQVLFGPGHPLLTHHLWAEQCLVGDRFSSLSPVSDSVAFAFSIRIVFLFKPGDLNFHIMLETHQMT